MERYFDIEEQKMAITLDLTKEGMKYTVKQISKSIKTPNLREVDKKEYNKLSKQYQS